MSKKPIIVFEGIEGSGKTFHINNVVKFLKKKKIKYIKIREPGGSSNAEKIRNLLMNKKSQFHKFTDLLLYLAARNENYVSLLSKNVNKKVILIDRFVDSTIAYQHHGMGLDLNLINLLNKKILNNLKVDFTFLHIVKLQNLRSRLKKRKKLNRYDKFNDSFYKKAQKGFIKLSKSKRKYMIIDSNKSIISNKKNIISQIIKLVL
tara:strand:+ start:49 stop:663 length:615 start_codon:yes stop_codon:yes gene_type:complete